MEDDYKAFLSLTVEQRSKIKELFKRTAMENYISQKDIAYEEFMSHRNKGDRKNAEVRILKLEGAISFANKVVTLIDYVDGLQIGQDNGTYR